MYLIGLTGGIASGKSVVARRLASHGAVHIDADVLARQVVEPGTAELDAIAVRFGPTVIASDGTLDRPALGAIVFADPSARHDLNAITHPAIRERTRELIDAAASDPRAVVVYDVPLLAEGRAGGGLDFDLIVVVQANTETRVRRMVELRGLTRDEATHRINSQASDAERLAIADEVIDSNGTLDETYQQTDALWNRVASMATRSD